MQIAHENNLANISAEHRELVPIFSSQVIARYEQFQYKGLEVDINEPRKGKGDSNGDGKEFIKLEKGLVGIASNYDGVGQDQSKFQGRF